MANKIIYELTRLHHRRTYRKGDLEDEQIQDFSQNFSTRTKANAFLEKKESEAKRNNWRTDITLVKRGDKKSELIVWTGDEWVNENTGSEECEYYWYIVKKNTL